MNGVEKGNDMHKSLRAVKEEVDDEKYLSRDFLDIVSSSLQYITKQLAKELEKIGFEVSYYY